MTDSLPEPALSPDQSTELPPANTFPAEVSARICRHMNQDHSDAVLLYAQGLAGLRTATAAQMEAIDCEGMDLVVWAGEEQTAIRIEFQSPLGGSQDAHRHLVDLVQQARHQLTD
jgi:putative heme iron utilization protein